MSNTVSWPTDTWINSDGLPVRFGRGNQVDAVVGEASTRGDTKTLIVDIDYKRCPAFSANEAVGQLYGGYANSAIPAGALIKSVTWQATSTFVGASATLSLGLVDKTGVVEIDNDGLFDALTISQMNTSGGYTTGGALIGTVLSATGYVWISVQTTTLTGGTARVTIEYFLPVPTTHDTE